MILTDLPDLRLTDEQEIYMSLRPPSSPDPALNPRLSAILAKAREVGYPKSNVDTAMNKVRRFLRISCWGNKSDLTRYDRLTNP